MFRKGDTTRNAEYLANLLTEQGNHVEEISADPVILNVYDGDSNADEDYLFTLTLSVTE